MQAVYGGVDSPLIGEEGIDIFPQEPLAASAIDALDACVAVLDGEGRVIFTNQRWRETHLRGAFFGPDLGLGVNYLAACRAIAAHLGGEAKSVLAALYDVLGETAAERIIEYPAGDAGERRWFQARISRYPNEGRTRLVVAHHEITGLKATEQALEDRALHDPLTNLPNRILFSDRLENGIAAARRDHRLLAVMFMDLDRFKEVNDTFGHHVGDLLLKEVGQRLEHVLRESDTLARMGGDEFGILLPGLTQPPQALLVAKKMLSVFERPFEIESRSLDVGASIGIALFPGHGTDPSSTMRMADLAMYKAKRQGGGFHLYEPAGERDPSLNRLTLMTGLRRAMERDELLLYYQPKVESVTGRPTGVEALVRWQHPEHGLLGPDDFVPLAERTGLIAPLSHWVLNAALRQCRAWRQAGLNLPVAVNLSMRNLQDPQLPQAVARLLRTYGLPASCLQIEIVEDVVSADNAIEVVTRLADLGVGLCIDDFGSGHSTLSYLHRLPINAVKIDRSLITSLVADEQSAVIVRSTVDLAHQLNLRVIVQGVENAQIHERLQDLGCDEEQGYYLGGPMPAEEMLAWGGAPSARTGAAHQEAGPPPLAVAPAEAQSATAAFATLLARIGLFSLLDHEDLDELAAAVRRRSFNSGDVIFRKEDSGYTLYLIAAGAVKIAVPSVDGRETILTVLRSGQFFGELSLFDDQPRSADAIAVEQTELLALSRENLLHVLEHRPGVAVQLLRVLSQRLRATNETLHEATMLSLPARVAKRLLDLGDLHGQRTGAGVLIPLALGAKELASMIGASTAEVEKVLAEYQAEGMVTEAAAGLLLSGEQELRAISLG